VKVRKTLQVFKIVLVFRFLFVIRIIEGEILGLVPLTSFITFRNHCTN